MTVLTRVNPVSYGVDAIRQIVLSQAGVPTVVVSQLSLTLFGQQVSISLDLSLVAAFGAIMTGLAVVAFRMRE